MNNLLNIIYLILFIWVARSLITFLDRPIVQTTVCGIYEACERDRGELIIEDNKITCIKEIK